MHILLSAGAIEAHGLLVAASIVGHSEGSIRHSSAWWSESDRDATARTASETCAAITILRKTSGLGPSNCDAGDRDGRAAKISHSDCLRRARRAMDLVAEV